MLYFLSLLLMIVAPVAHIVLCKLRLANRIRLSIIGATSICLLAGIISPLLATYIYINNLSPGIKCVTPYIGFAILGLALTFTVIPLSAIIFSIIAYYKKKRLSLPS